MDFKTVDGILKYPVSLFLPGQKPLGFQATASFYEKIDIS